MNLLTYSRAKSGLSRNIKPGRGQYSEYFLYVMYGAGKSATLTLKILRSFR